MMDGRVALITGASSGIGRAAAKRIADEGGSVALLALPGDDLDSAASMCRENGAEVLSVAVDVTDSHSVAKAFAIVDNWAMIDAVFNNAGISIVAPLATTTDEQFERLINVNLCGSFFVAREAARVMRGRPNAAMVNTASELALLGQAGYVAYTATKGGVLSMTRAQAAELAAEGIRVNVICPGTTDTPMFRAEFKDAPDPEGELRENERSVALRRIATSDEIASAAVWLLSDSARYVTGAQLVVDGGRTSCFVVGSIARGPRPGDRQSPSVERPPGH